MGRRGKVCGQERAGQERVEYRVSECTYRARWWHGEQERADKAGRHVRRQLMACPLSKLSAGL